MTTSSNTLVGQKVVYDEGVPVGEVRMSSETWLEICKATAHLPATAISASVPWRYRTPMDIGGHPI